MCIYITVVILPSLSYNLLIQLYDSNLRQLFFFLHPTSPTTPTSCKQFSYFCKSCLPCGSNI